MFVPHRVPIPIHVNRSQGTDDLKQILGPRSTHLSPNSQREFTLPELQIHSLPDVEICILDRFWSPLHTLNTRLKVSLGLEHRRLSLPSSKLIPPPYTSRCLKNHGPQSVTALPIYTYMHTYIHTYIHTYTHTYTPLEHQLQKIRDNT